MSSIFAIVLLGARGCSFKSVPTSRDVEVRRLLFIAEDRFLDLKTRADAVSELGDLKVRWTAKRLVNLLGQEYNLLMYETIGALGKIGDPAALPALYSIQDNKRGVVVPGPFPLLLRQVISELEKNRNKEIEEKGCRDL